MNNINLRRVFLYTLIGSVAVSALIGIGVILFGSFGEFETKVLLTALTVTATSILGMACGAYLETGRGRIVPVVGIVLALVSAVLWMFTIWQWQALPHYLIRSMMSATVLSTAFALVSLLSLARLDRRFAWSRWAVYISVGLLSAILTWLIWQPLDTVDPDISRLIGVLSIIVAALTVVTPIFHKLSGGVPSVERIDEEIARLRARIAELEGERERIAIS